MINILQGFERVIFALSTYSKDLELSLSLCLYLNLMPLDWNQQNLILSSPPSSPNDAGQPGSAVCIATEARHHLHGGRERSTHCNSWEPQRLGAPNTPFKQIHFTQICGGYAKIVGTAGENLG